MQFVVEPMKVEHVPAVAQIERRSFASPWPISAYRKEIQEYPRTYYVVARRVDGELDGRPGPAPVSTPAGAPEGGEGLRGLLARLLRPTPEPPSPEQEAELRSIVGYAGLWLTGDEAHVTTIAVAPEYRGRGIGELLLVALIDHAVRVGARAVTLEVRVSNHVAQSLYRKYTFKEVGVRKRYYSDNGEDALVMWTDPLDSAAFKETLTRNRARLASRLAREDP